MQFIKKTSSRTNIIGIVIKISLILIIISGIIFFLNKIDFPTPTKVIEKTLSNENFKIVK
tara:strand:+ start:36 stop:215 length:180 start_codon:yes stop_codon:yes gene_type:complete